MTILDINADVLKRSLDMFIGTLADFSDTDIYVRPCPGANTPAYQIGHLTNSETWMVSQINPAAMPKLPEGFDKKFSKEACTNDQVGCFGAKAELLDHLSKARMATIAWVKTLKPEDLEKPAPEKLAKFCPTIGHVVSLLPTHFAMHMGQMQVARRKLGKPVVF